MVGIPRIQKATEQCLRSLINAQILTDRYKVEDWGPTEEVRTVTTIKASLTLSSLGVSVKWDPKSPHLQLCQKWCKIDFMDALLTCAQGFAQ